MARTILVADDSPAIQKRAAGLLAGEGIEVVTVANGIAAIKKLPSIKPHIVLADVSMPGKDGYEVCDHIKKSPEHENTVVLLIVSDMEPYDEMRSRRVRADGIVKKPFIEGELQDLVRTYLSRIRTEPPPEPAAEAPVAVESLPVPEPPEAGGMDIGEVSLNVPDVASEPKLVESAEEPAESADAPPSDADRTVLFMNPIEVADPVMKDETMVRPPAETPQEKSSKPAVSEMLVEAPAPENQDASVSPTSFEKFPLEEAVEGSGQPGQVAPRSEESQRVEEAAPTEPPLERQPMDPETVRSIVERTVLRMMPEITEEVVERVTEEIKSELEKK